MNLTSSILTGTLAVGVAAQPCLRPIPPVGGLPTSTELSIAVTYSDAYQTYALATLPDGPAPTCGWPLVVFVHPLGQNRAVDLALQTWIASQGYAVWAYDVRAQGEAATAVANIGHVHEGSTLWGAIERYDLAEQIEFVANRVEFAGTVDATRVAVMGFSQGGAHAWHAAAWAGQTIEAPGRQPMVFPAVRCAIAADLAADATDDWLYDGTMWSSWLIAAITETYPGVTLDPAFVQTARTAFIAQDPAGLAATFAAEQRGTADLLPASPVPVLHSLAYFDIVSHPLRSIELGEARAAPHRILLSTIGHGAPYNAGEEQAIDKASLRWLHRWLWDVDNEVDIEPAHLLAEMPLDQNDLLDPTYAWSRAHVDELTPPATATRFHLHDDMELHEAAPAGPQAPASIEQVVDPMATTFNPTDYLDQPVVRELPNVLAACPLQELVYTATSSSTETQLTRSALLHLELVPDQQRWLLAVLLTAEPPGPGASEVLLASTAIAGTSSVPGVAEQHDLRLPPIAVRLPADTIVRLRLRNLWLREAPMPHSLQVAPLFDDFRVDVLHDAEPNGSWLDLPLEPVMPRLVADTHTVELATMAPVAATIRGGVDRAELPYFVAVGLSGQVPSVPYLNDVVPLDGDWLVVASAASQAAPFYHAFLGFLDLQGEATCTLDYSSVAPLPQVVNGWQLTLAAFVWDGEWAPTGAATNPCDVMLR